MSLVKYLQSSLKQVALKSMKTLFVIRNSRPALKILFMQKRDFEFIVTV